MKPRIIFILIISLLLKFEPLAQYKLLIPNNSKPIGFLADAPNVIVKRDDHVATIEMDFDEFAGWGSQLWNVGTDGKDPVGYLVRWWPTFSTMHIQEGCGMSHDHTEMPVSEANPHQVVTPNHIIQIQPLANNTPYFVKVFKINSLGQICSLPTTISFNGGDPTRVNNLRNSLTFFDDFNWPEGLPDERKWNNATGPQTDPRFNLFFINPQCHAHTINGTRNDGAGDRSQVAQRARQPILIENNVRRKIVFDMDGIFSPRSIWYLDLNPVKTDLTGHLSFFDEDGDAGLPTDVLRLKSSGHNLSVNLINSVGASYKIADVNLADFGRAMAPNVRRAFDVRVGTDGIQIFVDNTSVINVNFTFGAFKPGVYDLLWSLVGYNTSKDDNPYFISHWDNFGFDGPDVEQKGVHNYLTRIIGSDLQKAEGVALSPAFFTVNVPDDIRSTIANVKHEAWLVFSYQKNDYSTFIIQPGNHVLVNGTSFPLPQGANNSNPQVPGLVDYSGSTISNRIKIGEVMQGGISPLNIGENSIQFFAQNTGIMNVHIEVFYPKSAPEPPYTLPSAIHPYALHHDLPQLGPSAKIVFIDGKEFSYENDGTLLGPEVTGTIPVEILAGNGNWSNWAPEWLNVPATSAEIWSSGNALGIKSVALYLRPKGSTTGIGEKIAEINTNQDAPAPQIRYIFSINTNNFPTGDYELFLQATDSKDQKSHPGYAHMGFKFDASEWSGAYYPIEIHINNPNTYIFKGTNGPSWITNTSWAGGSLPPENFNGVIVIDSNCEVPPNYYLNLGVGKKLQVNSGKSLVLKAN